MPQRLPIEVARVDHLLCDACGLCMPLCPPTAIGMRREGLVIDVTLCTGCRKCIAPCPVGALTMIAPLPHADAVTVGLVTPPVLTVPPVATA